MQILFHNPRFRTLVYRWRPVADEEDTDSRIIRQLQLVFAHLQFSRLPLHNAIGLVDALSLSHSVQQDGQEFCKLFMQVVERQLARQLDGTLRNAIPAEFCGRYAYTTRCLTCEVESSQPSPFYELALPTKGKPHLHDSLQEYFQTEPLTGPNQYHCPRCARSQDATRRVVLTALPPVLSLHLLRFEYDMRTFSKKKITEPLRFPDTLDMRPYVAAPPAGASETEYVYDLQAVLIHRGPSASHGHYIAQVLEHSVRPTGV